MFVNPTLEEIGELADAAGLTIVQLHGQEGPAFCAEVARRTGCRVIKAARVQDGADIQALARSTPTFTCSTATSPGVPGGTGETFDWDLAADSGGSSPPRAATPVPLILSGGLRAGNVGAAIAAVQPVRRRRRQRRRALARDQGSRADAGVCRGRRGQPRAVQP